MKKTIIALAVLLGFSSSNVKAFNSLNEADQFSIVKPVEISPLCKAVATGNVEMVKTLIEQGVDVNKKSNGLRPLHYAAKFNRVEIIKLLITAGSDVHSVSDMGYTALNHAKKAKAKEAEMFLKRFK